MSQKISRISRVFLPATLLALLVSSTVSAEVLHSYPTAGEPSCFEIYVPAAGALLVEATDPGSSVDLRLDFHGRLCGDEPCEDAHAWRWLERHAAGGVVEVQEAGIHRLCAGAQDAELPLYEVKLLSGFAPAWIAKDGNPNEEEPDPDPTPLKDGNPNEEEPDPDPLSIESGRFGEICRRMAEDDHGDVMACASRMELGDTVRAELGDGWNDDDDVFSFVLDELRTVHLTVEGTATEAFLLDRWGDRLRSDDTASGEGLRLVKTLVPGLYYVRLRGGAGAYELALDLE